MWIDEEYEGEDAKGRKKIAKRRVAGYASSWSNLVHQFCQHRYKGSDAETMREFLKEMEQTFKDMVMLNETAVKADFKKVKKLTKERGIK